MQDEQYKRQGLMTEAFGAVINYAFHTLQLHRLEALVGAENVPSLKLMKKYGFTQEGILREHAYIAGEYVDSVCFALLREEYIKSLTASSFPNP